jgi:hypothetical protein
MRRSCGGDERSNDERRWSPEMRGSPEMRVIGFCLPSSICLPAFLFSIFLVELKKVMNSGRENKGIVESK